MPYYLRKTAMFELIILNITSGTIPFNPSLFIKWLAD